MTIVTNIRYQEYDVYIGRPGHGHDGYFGNPIIKNEECIVCGVKHTSSGDTINCYRAYFEQRIIEDEEFRQKILELRDKRLGCFCKPRECHGDVIVEYLERQKQQNT